VADKKSVRTPQHAPRDTGCATVIARFRARRRAAQKTPAAKENSRPYERRNDDGFDDVRAAIWKSRAQVRDHGFDRRFARRTHPAACIGTHTQNRAPTDGRGATGKQGLAALAPSGPDPLRGTVFLPKMKRRPGPFPRPLRTSARTPRDASCATVIVRFRARPRAAQNQPAAMENSRLYERRNDDGFDDIRAAIWKSRAQVHDHGFDRRFARRTHTAACIGTHIQNRVPTDDRGAAGSEGSPHWLQVVLIN